MSERGGTALRVNAPAHGAFLRHGASPHPNPLPAGERGQVAPSRVDATPAAGAGRTPSPRRGEGGGKGQPGRVVARALVGEAGR